MSILDLQALAVTQAQQAQALGGSNLSVILCVTIEPETAEGEEPREPCE